MSKVSGNIMVGQGAGSIPAEDYWRRHLRFLVPWTIGLWAIILIIVSVRWSLYPGKNSVYGVFAEAGMKWRAGEDVYTPVGKYRYSPGCAGVFGLFSSWPWWVGAWAWFLSNVIVLFGGLVIWFRHAVPGRRDWGSIALVVLVSTPLMVGNFNNLQANPMVLGCLVGTVTAVLCRRFWLAALLLTVASYLKIYPLALGLTLLLVYPRQLGWRWLVLMVAGGLFPFVLGSPGYVLESYRHWMTNLAIDQRYNIPLGDAYRDGALLWRFWGGVLCRGWHHVGFGATPACTINIVFYTAVQLTGAGVVGISSWHIGHRKSDWSEAKKLFAIFSLVVIWMMVLGPSTESSTYLLLAPIATWHFLASLGNCLDSRRLKIKPVKGDGARLWLGVLGYGLVLVAAVVPKKELHASAIQPIGALLVLVSCILWCRQPERQYDEEEFIEIHSEETQGLREKAKNT